MVLRIMEKVKTKQKFPYAPKCGICVGRAGGMLENFSETAR